MPNYFDFFSACTASDPDVKDDPATSANKGIGAVLPAYSNNPYDNAGRIYDDLFDEYYNGSIRSKTVVGIITEVTSIANANNAFLANNNSGYQPLSATRIEYLASRNSSDIAGIIGSSNLSLTAKVSFSNFLISLVGLCSTETDAQTMYDEVVKYEEKVLMSSFLGFEDKRIILTTTSIIRYSSYRAKKKPKKNTDPDWLILVTHVFGAEEGAEENSSKAILTGLVTGIVSNK